MTAERPQRSTEESSLAGVEPVTGGLGEGRESGDGVAGREGANVVADEVERFF